MNRTLETFLKIKGNKTITKEQQVLFKVPDFDKNWPKRHGKIELSEDDWVKAIASLKNSKGKFRSLQNKRVAKKQQLYLMQNVNNLVKIGISTNPKRRCKQLENASGNAITILRTWECVVDAFIIEKTLHETFAEYRMLGEWFDLDSSVVEEYVDSVLRKLTVV